jgi:Mce-associated membrane protein
VTDDVRDDDVRDDDVRDDDVRDDDVRDDDVRDDDVRDDDVRDLETVETDPVAPESTTEVTDTDVEDEAPAPTKRSRRRLRLPRVPGKVVTAILVALLVISGGAASWLYFKQYRPDQQTDFGVKKAVVSAASDGTVALLSYSSDTLDQDFASAKSHLAGDFLTYYVQFTQHTVAPAAKEKKLKTTARVTGAAVSELHPDSAVVLVFVDQSTTTKDSPQPSLAVSSVVLNLNRVNGNWLITKFTPV